MVMVMPQMYCYMANDLFLAPTGAQEMQMYVCSFVHLVGEKLTGVELDTSF